MPIGLAQAMTAFSNPLLVAAGIGVGVCPPVIAHVRDQLAMSRLPRASFALLFILLPASAAIIGAVVSAQMPTLKGLIGAGLVMTGVAIHKPTKSIRDDSSGASAPIIM